MPEKFEEFPPVQFTFCRTDSKNPDFGKLVLELDLYLAAIDGAEHAFYDQYNKTVNLNLVILAFAGERAVGCGAGKLYAPGIMELKRMYTSTGYRGRGVATQILLELERWAKECNCETCILETGVKQQPAVALYQKCGYRPIPNYGPYEGISNSICFEKKI